MTTKRRVRASSQITDPKVLDALSLYFQVNGMKQSAGRVLGYLVCRTDFASFSEIAEDLGMSRGGTSMTLSSLIESDLVRCQKHKGDRQEWYAASQNLASKLLTLRANKYREASDIIEKTLGGSSSCKEAQDFLRSLIMMERKISSIIKEICQV